MIEFIDSVARQNEPHYSEGSIVLLGIVKDEDYGDVSYLFATKSMKSVALTYWDRDSDDLRKKYFTKKELFGNSVITAWQNCGIYDLFDQFMFLDVEKCKVNPSHAWFAYSGPEISRLYSLELIVDVLKKEIISRDI